MTWINPISWGSKLLRLLHIKSKTTTDRHAHLPRDALLHTTSETTTDHYDAVPRTDIDDDPPSDHPHLPRDIILDILSRLPAECIFNCQCVSRPLQVLTTTPFFTHLQRQRSTSVIVVQLPSSIDEYTKLCYMDKEFETIEEKFMRSSSSIFPSDPLLLSSYDGFLMFSNFHGLRQIFYMRNPITGEQLTTDDKNIYVCGLYFNPFRKDHELLYHDIDDDLWHSGQSRNFGALNLRTKLRRDVGRFSYPPYRHRPPVIIKGTLLYWMIDRLDLWVRGKSCPPFSHSIMSFNVETEEFSTLEPGGRKYSTTELNGDFGEGMMLIDQMHLAEMDGELCLCDFRKFSTQLLLSIYNHTTQCWSTRTIVIPPDYRIPYTDRENRLVTEVVQIKDNEVLVRQGNRLVLYNMLSHACKITGIMGSMSQGIRAAVHAHTITSFHF
ncbi:hypothetical protein MKX01_023383 [Papaver californicum]|nr:hypothetical protein MKX01_023383 [Papaver californicum]